MKSFLGAAVLPAFLPAALFAAETRTEAPSPRDSAQVIVMGYGEYRPSATLYKGGASGSVRRTLGDGEIIRTGPVTADTNLDLDYEAKWTHNEFTGATVPYGDTESHFFGAHISHLFDENYGFGVVGGLELASETAADLFRDGIRGGAGASFVWNPSKTFTTETGITVQTQYGRNPTLSPYVVWRWVLSPSLELGVRCTGLTNGVSGTWWVTENKATSVKLSLSYDTANYALRDGAIADGYYTGDVPVRLVVTQFLTPHLFVAARGEVTLIHRETFSRDNDTVAVFQTKPSTAIALIVGARF